MDLSKTPSRVVRFGAFELDRDGRELRKRGLRLRLEEKPLQILEMLLERPGQVVSRKHLQEKLWPDTVVNYEFGLNTAVNKLRLALGDTAGNPRYVETVSRRGYRFIAGMQATAQTAVVSSQAPQESSIAVLPFQNASGSPELEYLSDGITEAVIHGLSQLDGIRVMGWNAVRRYKGKVVDPRVTGKNLGVASLLLGKVQQEGETLTASAELLAAETGWRLWGHRTTRDAGELFSLQEEIIHGVTTRLRPEQARTGLKKPHTLYSSNLDAYSDYLKGRYHYNRLTEDAMGESITYYQLAIEKDPEFALAHAGLADAYILLAFSCAYAPGQMIPLARAAAERALQLDENLAAAHAAFASIAKVDSWDWAGAERAYRHCLQLNPNDPDVHRTYGDFLLALGRDAEAVRAIQKAQELDPLSLLIGVEVAWNFFMRREYLRAREQALKVLELHHEFPAALHLFGLACEQCSQPEEAIAAFERASSLTGGQQTIQACLAHALGRLGRRKEAMVILDTLRSEAKDKYISPYHIALTYVGIEDIRKALDWLEKAEAAHDVWLIWLNREPRWDPLRDEPRFRAILGRMKLLD